MEKILIIAPHPDDEVLGCGGTISKLSKKGIEIYVAIMTNGNVGAPEIFPAEGTRRGREEALEAHKLLGVSETKFYDFPAPKLDTVAGYKIAGQLTELIKEKNIDTLFIPHRGDIHKDHRILFESALVASRPIGNNPVKRIFAYETLSETEWSAPFGDDTFIPTLFINIEPEIETKKQAFQCFTEPRLKHFPHPRSSEGIDTLARRRGMTISANAAEAFMIIREIMN